MADYKIFVKNKSGLPRAYFVYLEAPAVSGGSQVFQNVYIAAPTVRSNAGTATFSIHKDVFAVTGTKPDQALSSNVTVATEDWGIAKLAQGSKLGSHFMMTGAPDKKSASFDAAQLKQDCSRPGSFQISCEAGTFDIGNGANQFIGLGAIDPQDPSNIVPVAVIEAQPGTTNYFTPRTQYYISWGTFTSGQIIDVSTIAQPAVVDFTGKAANLAMVEHCSDGTWSITLN